MALSTVGRAHDNEPINFYQRGRYSTPSDESSGCGMGSLFRERRAASHTPSVTQNCGP